MYIVYILFMNHMHAGEWERAPGRTFTADILPILNCAHISLYPYTLHFCVKSLYAQLYTVCPIIILVIHFQYSTIIFYTIQILYIISTAAPFNIHLYVYLLLLKMSHTLHATRAYKCRSLISTWAIVKGGGGGMLCLSYRICSTLMQDSLFLCGHRFFKLL